MRKILVLAFAIALSPLLLHAQAGSPGTDSAQGPVDNGQRDTLQGCVQSVGGERYALTDDNGMVHPLTGNTAKLSHYVGHEVQITGKHSVRTTDTTQEGAASTVTERPAFRVHDVKDISGTCNSR